MIDNKHISDLALYSFQQDKLNQVDKVKLLEHICSCAHCSDRFAAIMSEEILTAPKNLKEKILKATNSPEVQFAIRAKKASKRMQLFLYSLKVGTATAAALLLLILSMKNSEFDAVQSKPNEVYHGAQREYEERNSLTSMIRDGMDRMSNSMLDFTNNIIKTEVTDYDQKKK